jgi:2-keto-4-pentenoate hydratase
MRMLSDHVGVSSNGVVVSPKSAAEAAVEAEIIARVRKLLTADFLSGCVNHPRDVDWFFVEVERGKDRIERSWQKK